eukprot:gnl/TRDRNA2_/TRDRNA2_162464_c0_seq4.p2 gnl/TRDRNA2_/TRDRNA2_162464_c0~~gnl/TRDRNA2_/TRDRNA2_162464_c0_seq4.p2  ORF type:complete len:104 (-),score=18.67 gnl/TRDRNA2_/TRDRNA2_162464_c0_seq4:138-449(-)
MLAGGYFVVASFEDGRCLRHKTAHAHVATQGHRTSRHPSRSHDGGKKRGVSAEEAHFDGVLRDILADKEWKGSSEALPGACCLEQRRPIATASLWKRLIRAEL